ACGAHFGIAPFISRRAYGVVSGVIGAGGNLGSVATQLIFFAGSAGSPVMTPQDGLIWMGVMTIGLTMILFTLWWPMWGSMLTPAKEDYAEEDYYLKEWTAEEVSQNLHITAMKFAMESRSQRGAKPMNGQMSAAALNATAGMANQNVQPGVVEVGQPFISRLNAQASNGFAAETSLNSLNSSAGRAACEEGSSAQVANSIKRVKQDMAAASGRERCFDRHRSYTSAAILATFLRSALCPEPAPRLKYRTLLFLATMGAADAVVAEKGTPVMPQFDVPVDSEWVQPSPSLLLSCSMVLPNLPACHGAPAFLQLAWFAFFMTFLATFAPASLITVIRENLVIDRWQNGSAGVAAVCGAIAFRLFMGAFLDNVGPRMGTAFTLLMLSPAVFCIALVNDIAGYTAARLFIGCSLCMCVTFVCCQFWVGIMFNVRIVGFANAIAAGWGNMGGGACHFIMPLLYQAIKQAVPGFQAWRWSFFIPGGIYIVTGIVVLLFGQDAPDGDFRDLKRSGAMASAKGNVWATLKHGMLNYRTIVLALTYGYSFGVELTVDNIIVAYLYDQFQMNLTTAGGLGALFGLMNLFSRASGGLLSDLAAVSYARFCCHGCPVPLVDGRWGMRGRLWTLWIIQTLGGVFCLIMGYMDYSLGATVATMVIFSIFCQQACGAHFGIAPFISRRAYGVVSGVIGAGGNLGSVATQLIFFAGSAGSPVMTPQDGLIWMGVMTIGLTMILFTLWWPMWGSMLTPAKEDYAEEDYYLKEWTAEEVSQNLHITAMKFAMESRSQRGAKPMNGQMSAAALNATAGMANQNVQPGVVEVSSLPNFLQLLWTALPSCQAS
ncbi:hypothetical protein QJQ45_021793, partial [Haematococcus lacustris]